ncbi:hypothetical protein RAZWK3B_11742 [Roseobacter sp. AzwK-3b]|nr:hypothetical protein RAZWK3B_11742 [Roseobacter sp. AzwK-3b]
MLHLLKAGHKTLTQFNHMAFFLLKQSQPRPQRFTCILKPARTDKALNQISLFLR